MIRFLIRYFLLFIVITCAAIGYYITETESGLLFSLRIADYFLPGKLTVDSIHGKLFSPIHLQGLHYQDTDISVDVDNADLQWQPSALLYSRIAINSININKLQIHSVSSSTPSHATFDWNQLKFLQSFSIHTVKITDITVTLDNKQPIQITNISLEKTRDKKWGFQIQANENYLQGYIDSQWHVDWKIALPSLASYVPQTEGNFFSAGEITGELLHPYFKGVIQSKQLKIADILLNNLQADIDTRIQLNSLSTINLSVDSININGYKTKKLNINLSGKSVLENNQIRSDIDITLNQQKNLALTVLLPQNLNLNDLYHQPFNAQLNLSFPDLGTFTRYIPEIDALHGTVKGFIQLTGNLAAPITTGEINLTNGYVGVPALGTAFKNITFHLNGNQSTINYDGKIQSADGSLQLHGNMNISQPYFPGELKLQGERFLIIDSNEYIIRINPNLKITYSTENAKVTGSIFIPEAFVHPKDFSDTITLPEDVVFTNHKATTETSLLSALPPMEIKIKFGDKISFHYQDFEAMLRGELSLFKEANNPITANGELKTTQGNYTAYKKTLTIKQGRLLFTGGLITNPSLDIKATRDIKTTAVSAVGNFAQDPNAKTSVPQAYEGTQTISIGVQVLGTIDKPIINLISDPAMSQANILSYLVLGIPQSEAGANQQTLLRAASALNLGGKGTQQFEDTMKSLQNSLGLNEFNVESVPTYDPNASKPGSSNTTSLVVGKQLAPNLYLHYSIGLFNPVSIVNLRYKLSKRWALQSETSAIDTGADLLYSIERD